MKNLPFPEPLPPEDVIDSLADKLLGPIYDDSEIAAWETAKHEQQAKKLREIHKEKPIRLDFEPVSTDDPDTVWVTASDAALSLGVTRRRVGQLCEGKDIRALKVGGRWMVDSESVLTYAQNRAEHLESKKRFFLINVRSKLHRCQVKQEIEEGGNLRSWREKLVRRGVIEPTEWQKRKATREASFRKRIDQAL